ncbi:PspA/IM30 family protein [Paenibacillus herberti]|uniref:Phage shock protein A n=1 Tax=Paenibacillus herberti TaxID=1619309 RepID=A0A229P5K5_9BACL|nr:PspA/IM30 family protein [Paenibacillus herberti]OXM17380.1 phage shock protein A [Paenibacillus herberti]
MGIFKRVKDITKASVHEVLDKMEDPIVMLNQYLRDMEQEIHQAEVTVAKQMANERRMQQRYEEAQRSVADRDSKAEAAIRSGQEDLARTMLEEKLYFEEKTQEFSRLHAEGKAQADDLKHQLYGMKDEYYQLRNKRNELVARAQMAKAQKQMSQASASTSHLDTGSASRGFNRMEEKILRMEAEADVLRTPHGAGANTYRAQVKPENQLKVEEQLQLLKNKLNPPQEQQSSSEE